MTIQPSVLIWTIICFLALFLILRKFLFGPVLTVMDERNGKIEKDKAEKKAALDAAEKARIEKEQAYIEAQKAAMRAGESDIEKAREKSAKAIAKKKAEYELALENKKAGYDAESKAMEQELEGEISELARAYADMLIF